MKKFEVWVTKWSDEYKRPIKVTAGCFEDFMCAKIFAEAYKKHYSASTEIIEYVRKER